MLVRLAVGLASLLRQAVEGQQEGAAAGQPGKSLVTKDFDIWPYILNLVVALAIVIGLILLITWLLKITMGRRFSFGGSGLLQVVASVPLGERRFISVLRVGERYYLIGISAGEISLLSTLDADEIKPYLESRSQVMEGGFAGLLQRLRGGKPGGKEGSQP
jgi:flagellar protein FliO/FliZ